MSGSQLLLSFVRSTLSVPVITYIIITRAIHFLGYHAWSAFLFTKSDIKTIVIPITCLSVFSAPLASLSQLLPVIFWLWLQLLQVDVSNQVLDPEEDKKNKPYRPLPAGRITYEAAYVLRWVLPLLCLVWSARYSKEVMYASLANCIATFFYHELGFASGHWLGRNILNTIGYASFEVGACLIAGKNIHSLDYTAWMSIICSAGIITTTIHAQDFKDIEGDKEVGRHTLPLEHPIVARYTIFVAVFFWSIILSLVWSLSTSHATGFTLLGSTVGLRFLTKRSIKNDERSYYLYNVWLSCAMSLPAYSQLVMI